VTKKDRHRTIRRPLIVAVAIGAATLAAVPAAAVVVAPVAMRTSTTPPRGDGPGLGLVAGPAAVTVGDLIGGLPGYGGVAADVPVTADIEALIAQALAAPTLAWSTSNAPSLTSVLGGPATPILPASTTPQPTFPLSGSLRSTVPLSSLPTVTTTAQPGTAAAAAIDFALAQRGLPYVWGGNGPLEGDAGFDCSGLTTAAYDYAGISLPRTAHTQYYAGPHVPAGVDLEPGDLVFYGVPQRVHHVGLYIGDGRMVSAPTFGKPVRLAFVRYNGDDYLGATRPAAGRDAPELLESPDLPFDVPPLPKAPAPTDKPDPVEFPAPPVPEQEVADMAGADAGAPTAPDPATAGAAQPHPAGSPKRVIDGPPSGDRPTGTPTDEPAPTPAPVTATPPVTASVPDPEPSKSPEPAPPDPKSPDPKSPGPTSSEPTSPGPTSTRPADGPTVAAAPEPEANESESEAAADTTREPAPEPDTGEPPVPSRLTLPGGTNLALSRAERGADGLPPGRSGATLSWRPGKDGAWTAAVRLPDGTATAGLSTGATITVTGADGTRQALTIRARRTLDPADAAESARRATGAPRLVLLLPDGDEVLVVVAE